MPDSTPPTLNRAQHVASPLQVCSTLISEISDGELDRSGAEVFVKFIANLALFPCRRWRLECTSSSLSTQHTNTFIA
jgi:hypothetical protein